ncbi:MAG: prolipoprotein diacylglyceryl transferase family protein, partial [Morganella morganii]
VSGLFLIGYGLFRIIVEFFRQPDAQLGLFGGISMGQILSVPMIIIGVLMMVWAYKCPGNKKQSNTGKQNAPE